MTLPTLPAQGSTNWYGYMQALDTEVRAIPAAGTDDAGGGALYVTLDGSDNNDGLSWATAKRSVKAAVLALPVRTSGSESFNAGTVFIGQGEFVEDGAIPVNREIRFVGVNARSDHEGTQIKLAAAKNVDVFRYEAAFASVNGFSHGVVFEHLSVDANAANQTGTTITGALTSGATSLTVTSAANFPAVPFEVYIDDELLTVTAKSGTTWTVTRGKMGTLAAAHNSGATIRYAGSCIRLASGGFNCETRNTHLKNFGAAGLRLDGNAVNYHGWDFNASLGVGPALAYLPSSSASGTMLSLHGGQIDDCGRDAIYIEGEQAGPGNIYIGPMKFESFAVAGRHQHCIAHRPASFNGSGMAITVDNVIAYGGNGGGREAVVYNYNGTAQGASWQVRNVFGVDGYLKAFKSDRYGAETPGSGVNSFTLGNFDSPMNSNTMQIGTALIFSDNFYANPEGNVAAPKGSMYLFTGGGAGATLWIKASGSGNTGWTGIT